MIEAIPQGIFNGIVKGGLLATLAIGFTLNFAVLRFVNFSVAAYATIGAFAGYVANTKLGFATLPSLAVAFVCAGAVGVLSDEIALRRLRLGGSALMAAVGSLALNIILENSLRFVFGNDMRAYDLPITADIFWAGLRMGIQQVQSLACALAVMVGLFLFFKLTRIGWAMRAVADNPDLARLKGIDPIRIAWLAAFLGAAIAGVGGMLLGLDAAIDPLTGSRVILSVFAAAVLGGLGNIPGAVAGALVIGIAEEVSVIFVAPSYQSAIGFLVIFFVLTVRAQGLLGMKGE
jgi:branched-subunit amino acid ABC-type transport system permease component